MKPFVKFHEEIVVFETYEHGSEDRTYMRIELDGIRDPHSYIYGHDHEDPELPFVRIANPNVIYQIGRYSMKEVGEAISGFSYLTNEASIPFELFVEVCCSNKIEHFHKPAVDVELIIDPLKWKQIYSVEELGKKLAQTIEINHFNGPFNISWDQYPDYGNRIFSFQYRNWEDENILTAISKTLGALRICYTDATKYLYEETDSAELSTLFAFPESIKPACKQYLMYFGQFLKDLGVNTETEVHEKAGKTLFKVIPEDKETSLKNINDALGIFLKASNFNQFEEVHAEQNIPAYRWAAEIKHFKRMYVLATIENAELREEIEVLQIEKYKVAEKAQLYLEKLTEITRDEESIIPNILSVKAVEMYGVKLNTPEIIRQLKILFGKQS